MTEWPFRDRPPTEVELTRLRLGLSTFCDGSGQVVRKNQKTYPGWRDFERCTAEAIGGICPENKGVFDVWVHAEPECLPFGISCKTSSIRAGHILMELHNSSAKAHAMLQLEGIAWKSEPEAAGVALVNKVCGWHEEVQDEVDVARSTYLVLTHDTQWVDFEIFWYGLAVNDPDPAEMIWRHEGKRIEGVHQGHRYWEWYGDSGGQLKYYPPFEEALWRSGPFKLLEPPERETPLSKAQRYWPDLL